MLDLGIAVVAKKLVLTYHYEFGRIIFNSNVVINISLQCTLFNVTMFNLRQLASNKMSDIFSDKLY